MLLQMLGPKSPRELTIPVAISDHAGIRGVEKHALIDSGAVLCFVSPEVADSLRLQDVDSIPVFQADGKEIPAQRVVSCIVKVERIGSFWVQAVVFGTRDFILGMDWLNRVNSHYTRQHDVWTLKITKPRVTGRK